MTDNDKTLFATIHYTQDGKLHILIDREGIKPMDGHQLLQCLDGSIETLQQIKADVLAGANASATVLFEQQASMTH